jgi:hypothetical protein
LSGANSESLVLSQSADTSKRKCQEKKDLSCGETIPGSSIMTMCQLMHRYSIRDFLADTNTTVLPQPPYSPDLALANFFLFPKLKSSLKGR